MGSRTGLRRENQRLRRETLVKLAFLEQLLDLNRSRSGLALVTDVGSGEQLLLTLQHSVGDLSLDDEELARVRRAIDEDRSQIVATPTRVLFVEVWSAVLRLVVVGGVHTAQSLVPLANLLGYDVTLVDPRAAFASVSRFPNTSLLIEWPDVAVHRLEPDRRTAVVTLTHNPRIDDQALIVALRSEAFYIGALGSRRTHEQRRERLGGEGFDATALNRVRGPIGLAIGALTPGEIAVSIMAEITAVLRRSPLAVRA
jgi:xanthine dehydrogenase accessory factor